MESLEAAVTIVPSRPDESGEMTLRTSEGGLLSHRMKMKRLLPRRDQNNP
jgi:hypothetical protein